MRITTWNVNSLKARLERVEGWLERASPDVLLIQETKLHDDAAPHEEFARHGYELAHHGEGRWNGVAIASRVGIRDVITNFGEPLRPTATEPLKLSAPGDAGDDEPFAEARMISAVCGDVRVTSIYAPNGRLLDSPFYYAKLAWFGRLLGWLQGTRSPSEPLVIGGDYNVAPEDADVWDPAACNGGTHVSAKERAAFRSLCNWGLSDAYRLQPKPPERYTWWDYRAGHFHKNFGMRIDHLLVSAPLAARVVATEIDREARKGKPIPSDHAPIFVDLDAPGRAIDAGWRDADARIASRRATSKSD